MIGRTTARDTLPAPPMPPGTAALLTSALADRLTHAARDRVCQSQLARHFRRSSSGRLPKEGSAGSAGTAGCPGAPAPSKPWSSSPPPLPGGLPRGDAMCAEPQRHSPRHTLMRIDTATRLATEGRRRRQQACS